MCAPRAVLGPVKRGVTDTPRREKSCEARVSHHPLACARYFTPYTVGSYCSLRGGAARRSCVGWLRGVAAWGGRVGWLRVAQRRGVAAWGIYPTQLRRLTLATQRSTALDLPRLYKTTRAHSPRARAQRLAC